MWSGDASSDDGDGTQEYDSLEEAEGEYQEELGTLQERAQIELNSGSRPEVTFIATLDECIYNEDDILVSNTSVERSEVTVTRDTVTSRKSSSYLPRKRVIKRSAKQSSQVRRASLAARRRALRNKK